MTRRGGGRFVVEEKGATIVEFALVAPVLILLLLVCLDFARALNAYVTITSASREGARYAALHPGADGNAISAAVFSRSAPLNTSAIAVAATYDDGSGAQAWPATGVPESVPTPQPITVRVAATYDWNATSWLVGSFFSLTGGSRTFAAESTTGAIR